MGFPTGFPMFPHVSPKPPSQPPFQPRQAWAAVRPPMDPCARCRSSLKRRRRSWDWKV